MRLIQQSVYFYISLVTISTFFSCKPETYYHTHRQGKLKILATTSMAGDMVRQIVQDKAEVQTLMGAGIDPHLYKATQGDLERLMQAHAVVYNGLLLEGKMESIFEKLQRAKPVYALASPLLPTQLISSDNSHHSDPHIWFDTQLWAACVLPLAEFLATQDRSNAACYRGNAAAYRLRLDCMHQSVRPQIADIPQQQRVLITSHDAFQYFGRAYDIEVQGLQGISTVAEFGLRDVSNLVHFICNRHIKALFVESSVSSKPLEAVREGCRQRNCMVGIGGNLYSDALGAATTPEGTYIGMMHHNIATIAAALK